MYFEQERRESDGSWHSHGVGASDQLDLELAQWEVDRIQCDPKGDSIEVWVDVVEHPWRTMEWFVVEVNPDLSTSIDVLMQTSGARW